MSAHKELIARLEGLEGPCRECDLLIASIVSYREWRWYAKSQGRVTTDTFSGEHAPICHLEEYTASIDAALTTVPKGWHWELGPERAEIAPERWEHYENANDDGGQYVVGYPTPIAICIAVVKAMEAQS